MLLLYLENLKSELLKKNGQLKYWDICRAIAPKQVVICYHGVSNYSGFTILYIGHSVALPILIPPCELKLVKLAG